MAQTGLILNEKSTGYDPEKLTLDPATQTVRGQVQDIMKSDSPFLTEARTRAAQGMNARGLINSSMALGEGERAAYAAALPIAERDANAALTVAGRNQDATNASRAAGAQAENVMGQQELSGEQAMEQQELRGAQSKELAQIEAQYKQMMQTNDSAARFYSQITLSMGEVMKAENMSAEAKATQITKLKEQMKNGLFVIGNIGNIQNLDKLLRFGKTEEEVKAAETAKTAEAEKAAAAASAKNKTQSDWEARNNYDMGESIGYKNGYINTKTGEFIDSNEYRTRQVEGRL